MELPQLTWGRLWYLGVGGKFSFSKEKSKCSFLEMMSLLLNIQVEISKSQIDIQSGICEKGLSRDKIWGVIAMYVVYKATRQMNHKGNKYK